MTDPVRLVRTRLLATGAVTALASTRIYSGILPQAVTKPAIAIQLATNTEGSHTRGPSGLRDARVQVHAVGANRDAAVDLADAIEGRSGSSLNHFRGTIAGTFVQLIEYTGVTDETWRPSPTSEYEVMREYRIQFGMN